VSVTLQCSAGALAVLGDSYIRIPARAAWEATLRCAAKVAPAVGEAVQLLVTGEGTSTAKAPSQTFSGTVVRRKLIPGTEELYVALVAGAGKLTTFLGPSEHVAGVTAVPLGIVIADILQAAGERPGAGVIASLDTFHVQRWNRLGGTTARDALDQAIGDVAAVTGQELGWRMLADGTFWAGVEAWPVGGAADFIEDTGDDGTLVYGPNGAPLFPGTTIDGQRAVEVTYSLEPPKLRAFVRHAIPDDPPYVARGLELYRQAYAASVETQNADGSLDVVCDDPRAGELRFVPFRLGIPGAQVSGIPRGTRVRVAFETGSPRGAIALELDQDPTATEAFALIGDSCGYLSATCAATPGPVTFILSPTPTGSPGEVQVVLKGPGHKYLKGVHA
jgi:hypothetical protein